MEAEEVEGEGEVPRESGQSNEEAARVLYGTAASESVSDDGVCVKTLFVFEAPPPGRLKVAGGDAHDLPLDEPANAALLMGLERAAEAQAERGEPCQIVVAEVDSFANADLAPRGAGVCPHAPVDVDVVRIPPFAKLSKKGQRAVEGRFKKGLHVPEGFTKDILAGSTLAMMQPGERARIGIKAQRVRLNVAPRAAELAKEWEAKRKEIAEKVAAAQREKDAAQATAAAAAGEQGVKEEPSR